MTRLIPAFILFLLVSCANTEGSKVFSSVEVETILADSLSIRAIELMDAGSLAFAANKGAFGLIDLRTGKSKVNTQQYDTLTPEFRSIANTSTDFFMLSVANPALLYKTGDSGSMEVVYKEEDEKVFYDSMTFWNNREGIAIGDSMDGCLSIIITRDGGNSWNKVPCSSLPKAEEGEGAFAASNTNIKVVGDKAWIATTKGNIYYTENKGISWEVIATPILSEKSTQGIYSVDFYDEKIGFVIGGDYTDPDSNFNNKAVTVDGGKTWQLVASGQLPDYRSCVQFVPNSDGQGLIAIGFNGIAYSHDRGENWNQLSDESFYTIRFLNDSVAYAAGKNRVAKLTFK
ncbi:WD40/YVTN/BNR-like repeat-containing protein [Arenibacter latericius]|uniref:WD40/YVTN/BNR-like repeat-containing protein n=1 Tax=Arenibacter latericius TaxID=86104 RepID=UPI00040B01A2|nr:oxidoreductase [Arenibacter latericius]MDX1363495.1 oxidoreductase [Arenibacter latericius]